MTTPDAPAPRSAPDDLSDRDLLDAGARMLTARLVRAVLRSVISGACWFGAADPSDVIAAGIGVASGNAGERLIPRPLTPAERQQVVSAFDRLDVDSADIIVAAAELSEDA